MNLDTIMMWDHLMKRAWRWYKQFKETGNVERRHSTGQPRRFDEDVDRVRQVLTWSQKKSISQTSTELQMPQVTAHKIL